MSMDSIIDFQAIFGVKPQAIAVDDLDTILVSSTLPDFSLLTQSLAFQYLSQGQLQYSDEEYSPLSQEYVWATGTLADVAYLPIQLSPDLLLSASVNYELGTQPIQTFVPEHGVEGQTLSGSSARRHQHLCLPVVQGGQEKVKCTWPGCWRVIKKDGHTRHVDETHLRKVKAVCTRCERAFPRT